MSRKSIGTHGFSDPLRVAVAAMILVWFAYYANRPQQEGLYANALLYGYLLADVGRILLATWRRPRLLAPAALGIAIIALVFVPYIAGLLQRETGRYLAAVQHWSAIHDESIARKTSGIWLRLDDRGRSLFEKAEYLASIKHEGPIAYATVDPYLIPKLSGVWSDLPFVDVFWESITKHQYDQLMNAMLDPGRKRVLIDSEASVAACEPPAGVTVNPEFRVPKIVEVSRAFYRKLRSDLAKHYTLVDVTHGWEDWRRKH